MRVFIAIELKDECKKYISSIMREVRDSFDKHGTFVPLDNFHITLEFLSERDEDEIAIIKRVMDDLNGRIFTITLKGEIGSFKTKERNKRTYFIEMEESRELNEIHRELHQRLEEAGFTLEKRKYHPHVTIVRNGFLSKSLPTFPSFTEKVDSICLMKSERINGRMVYTPMYRHLLDNPV